MSVLRLRGVILNDALRCPVCGGETMRVKRPRVFRLLHLSYRLRRIALESAVGGMLLSVVGMAFAALGVLSPVAGAIAQEAIDLLAVLNALRTARSPSALTDF